ncbi:hypothetical protein GCM10023191_036780 [Actinoallomurus oryzae]|uniref:Uncharacterized protein n=1 Tax=Actinoallomurus oryzae TaxID=502180 RepID=A0ABP8Q0U1_9ACTN
MSAAGLHDVRRNSELLMIETSDTALFRPISSDLRMPRTSGASLATVRATRRVLSSMCQMAMDEGYRTDNPIRTIRLPDHPK